MHSIRLKRLVEPSCALINCNGRLHGALAGVCIGRCQLRLLYSILWCSTCVFGLKEMCRARFILKPIYRNKNTSQGSRQPQGNEHQRSQEGGEARGQRIFHKSSLSENECGGGTLNLGSSVRASAICAS